MNNKNSILLNSKNANKNIKELLKKKLRDRNKLKGFCFSYGKKPLTLNHVEIQKILYKTYYDISKKIMKENKLKFAIKDYKNLKKNISSFNEKYKNDEDKTKSNIKKKSLSYEKINYTNLKELFKEFLRDKNKHNENINNIIKSKIKIENANRNIRKNKINAILEKVSLNSNKIKTKVDTGKNKSENHENSYKKLLGILNISRKKLEKKVNISRKNKILDINKNENSDILNKNIFLVKANSNCNIRNNNIMNSQKQKYINLYNSFDNNEKDKNKKMNKDKEIIIKNNRTKENLKLKERAYSLSRNKIKFNNIYNNNTTSSNTNIKNKRIISSTSERFSFKIKNKPLYTSKIEDVLNEYNRIKKKNKLIKMKYKEIHLITYNEIDNIMKIKEDLLIFDLKQRFLKKQFPKPIIKKENKKETFVKKFKRDLDFIADNHVINNNILL